MLKNNWMSRNEINNKYIFNSRRNSGLGELSADVELKFMDFIELLKLKYQDGIPNVKIRYKWNFVNDNLKGFLTHIKAVIT